MRATIATLDVEIKKILDEYDKETSEAMVKATKEALKIGKAQLKASSKTLFKGRGRYAGGWSSRLTVHRVTCEGVIYNRLAGLPHLLEHGHEVILRGKILPRYSGRVHIAPVQDKVDEVFEEMFRREIE